MRRLCLIVLAMSLGLILNLGTAEAANCGGLGLKAMNSSEGGLCRQSEKAASLLDIFQRSANAYEKGYASAEAGGCDSCQNHASCCICYCQQDCKEDCWVWLCQSICIASAS